MISEARPPRLLLILDRARAFGRTPRGLLTGFVALHATYILALASVVFTGSAEGDVPLYRLWATQASHGIWPVLDAPWVYPAGALVPIMLPIIFGRWSYQLVWLLMVAVANGAALWTLTGGLRRRSAYRAAWYWLLIELVLAPVSMLRLEAISAPLAIAALVLISRRPAIAGALIAAATWVKVWPAAIAGAAVIASSKRWLIIAGGIAMSALVAVTVGAAGGASQLLSFATIQGDRTLQLEAPVATPWVWATIFKVPGAAIVQNEELATREVAGPGTELASEVIGWLMMLAVGAILVLIVRAQRTIAADAPRRGILEQRLVIVGAFALTAALIVFNKVGSPQYMLWLAPIVTVGLIADPAFWRRPATWMLAISFLTTLVFPVLYLPLIDGNPIAALVLLVRNVLVIGIFVWSVAELVRWGRAPALVRA